MAAQKELREHIAANSDTLRRYYWREKVHDRPGNITFKSGYKELEPLPEPPQGTQLTPDPKSTEVINKAVERFAKDFPAVDDQLQYHRYIYEPNDNQAITQLEIDKQGKLTFGVEYNLNLWHNVTVVKEQVQRKAATGGHTKTDKVESIVFHELGHAAMDTLLLRKVGYNGGSVNIHQRRLYRSLYNQQSQKVYEIAYPDFIGNYRELIRQIKTDLSETACGGSGEFVAECFAQYYCAKAS